MSDEFVIRNTCDEHWVEISKLISTAIPNALISRLGPQFSALYYKSISKHQLACSYAAFDKTGRLAGIILGTLDRKSTRRLGFTLKARLLLSANIRLFSPSVIWWLLSGLRLRGARKYQGESIPNAELKVIAVHKSFQGKGLANILINELEKFFKKNNLEKPYLILTEKSNVAANRLYERIGANFIETHPYHDKFINEWHKSLT